MAANKLNAAYWRKRALQQVQKQVAADNELNLKLKAEYDRILHELDKELAVFYARYADNEGISLAKARKLLRNAELEDFRMSLDKFREKAILGGYDEELNEIYLRSRVSRLQALETQIELRMQDLFGSQQDLLHDHLAGTFLDTYYQSIYAISQQTSVLASFARIDFISLESILARPWLDDNFSSRIWADRDKLTRELETTLAQAFVRGEPLDRTAKMLAERMGVSQRRAATLVNTESAHIAAEATMRGYQQTGVEQYRFEAGLDLKTCPLCGAMDGKIFALSERITGANYPPLHPNCRCTTVPVTEFELDTPRAARDPVTGKTMYVDKGLTYDEWHKKYVEDVPEAAVAEKVYRNRYADQKQHERYRAILGDEIPRSLDSFQRMKYNEPKKWDEIERRKQDILNHMDFADMGMLHRKLDNREVRQWYIYHDKQIPDMIDKTQPLEMQARQACKLRNLHRMQARELMRDQKARRRLDETDPNRSFEDLVADKMKRKGLTQKQAYEDILKTSAKTRKSVNKSLGLE